MKKLYGERALLNLPGHHSTAAIVAEVNLGNREEDWPFAVVSISDCSRVIRLEFGDSLENDQHKVDTMISALRAFRRGLPAYHRDNERRKREDEARREVSP